MCNYCMELRQEAYPEDHKWELVSKGKYQIVDADTHSCLVEQECWTCGKRKKETVKEKHLFNKFNICSICGYKKGEIIPLKPGKAANVNDKTQLKISLSKQFPTDNYHIYSFINKQFLRIITISRVRVFFVNLK